MMRSMVSPISRDVVKSYLLRVNLLVSPEEDVNGSDCDRVIREWFSVYDANCFRRRRPSPRGVSFTKQFKDGQGN